MYIATYSICYVIWETLLELFGQDKNQTQIDLIRSTLSEFNFFDTDSEYQNDCTIYKKVFWYLDKIISNKSKLYDELSKWIVEDDKKDSHELERQLSRWINGEQSPSWKYVKYFCDEKFVPSKELFTKSDYFTDEENKPEKIWMGFRQIFLLAYFINNLFNSLENKQKLITKMQKEYLVSGIRYMFRVTFFPNNLAKSDMVSEMNFVFYSLYHTFYYNMPKIGLQKYIYEFIPNLIHLNPAVNFGINHIFEE